MTDWQMWLTAVALIVILEMFTGTFYLLMIGVGLAAGSVAALMGLSISYQILMAATVGIVATVILRRSKFGRFQRHDASRDPNINMDINQTINVKEWLQEDGGNRIARVMYRGAQWDVELAPGSFAQSGAFKILEIRGSHLIVSNKNENESK